MRDGDGRDLIEFAFESQVADDLTAACFARLARQSWSFNIRAGLTGELRLQDRRFVQVVEGPCAAVLPLAARILADPRHAAIRIIALRSLAARRFVAWTVSGFDLGAPPDTAAQPAANLRFMPSPLATRLLAAGLPAS